MRQPAQDPGDETSDRLGARRVLAVHVDCGAGHKGEPTPLRLKVGDRTVDVDVVDSWLAPDHRYFKVKGQDGATYIVRHDVASGIWQLVLFDSRGRV